MNKIDKAKSLLSKLVDIKGSGAPKKEETKPIFIRVPLSDYDELLKRCKEAIYLFYNKS